MRFVRLLVLALLPTPLAAQSGPTMAQTEAWISKDMLQLTWVIADATTREGGTSVGYGIASRVVSAKISKCTFMLESEMRSVGGPAESQRFQARFVFHLKSVDRSGLTVVSRDLSAANTQVTPFSGVRIPLLPSDEALQILPDAPIQKVPEVVISARSEKDGGRILKAIDRAAELCGATKSTF